MSYRNGFYSRTLDTLASGAVYTIPGVSFDRKKDFLGMYLSENEGAKFWLAVLTDLKNRRMQDVFIA